MRELAGRKLRTWQRFHVRTTALFAAPLFAVMAVVSALAYRQAVAGEHALLQARLRATSVALASAIDPADVTPVPGAALARLLTTLKAVGHEQGDLVAVYVLVPEDD